MRNGKRLAEADQAWSLLTVPPDVATFRPLGWSPSGRYYAIPPLDAEGTPDPEVQVVVFDLVKADQDVFYGPGSGLEFRTMWDARQDRLWWFDPGADGSPLRTIGPDGNDREEARRSIDATGWQDGPGWFVGTTGEGPVFQAGGGRLWRVEKDGVHALGSFYTPPDESNGRVWPGNASYDETAGVLWSVLYATNDGRYHKVVYVSRPDGSGRRPLWQQDVANPVTRSLGLDTGK